MNHHSSVLQHICAKAKEILPEGAHLWLYGSRARGDARPDSDWDLLLLLDKDLISEFDHDSYSYPLFELGWEIDAQIHPMMFTMNDWEARRMTPLYQNVERERIVLC